ncbi:3063_t:CDS:1, partial [Gigaspora margarita]
ISSKKLPKLCNNRTMQNWIEILLDFNIQLHRIAGQDNYAADYLTRGTTQELEELKEQKELLKRQEILERKKEESS